jgi:glycosyltransferase involved in cell wall biosynthesis
MVYHPLVEIIIPTSGNRPKMLKEAINSCLRQEYSSILVTVVSDGPLTTCLKRLSTHFGSKVSVVSYRKSYDPSPLRNFAAFRSQAEFICFLDDDDFLLPNHISLLLTHNDQSTIPFSKSRYEIRTGRFVRTQDSPEPNNPMYYDPNYILEQNIAPIQSFLLKTDFFRKIGGFDESLVRLEDWDLWARLSVHYELKLVDEFTSVVRVDNNSQSSRTLTLSPFHNSNSTIGERLKGRYKALGKLGDATLKVVHDQGLTLPKVSVIMPVFNAEKFLDQSIKSILDQTYSDWELIIIDDGSTDASPRIIESFNKDIRIRSFRTGNQGVTKALNFGLSHALGKYIARMDADDVSDPNRFLLQNSYLDNNPNCGLLGTRFEAVREDLSHIEYLDVEETNDELQNLILKSCRFGHPTVFIRRASIEKVGEYHTLDGLNTVEDYDLWLRISEHFEISNLTDYLLKYRIHPGQITQAKREENQRATKRCIKLAKRRRIMRKLIKPK